MIRLESVGSVWMINGDRYMRMPKQPVFAPLTEVQAVAARSARAGAS